MTIGRYFRTHRLVGLGDVFLGRGNQMQKNPCPLDMAEKTVADADAFMSAFDQAGNVCDDKFTVVDARDTKIGMQCRKGIVGDFRLCGADTCQKG